MSNDRALVLNGNLVLEIRGNDLSKQTLQLKSLVAAVAKHAEDGPLPAIRNIAIRLKFCLNRDLNCVYISNTRISKFPTSKLWPRRSHPSIARALYIVLPYSPPR